MDLVPDIAGRTVTADALLTQTEIGSYLHDRGAEYVFVALCWTLHKATRTGDDPYILIGTSRVPNALI